MKHYLVLFLCILALFACATVADAPPTGFIKSRSDNNEYRALVLDNQMKILLVSSSKERAAAALDVYVGSANNPQNRPGMAHFLEHMLFLGTEKYPQKDAYQSFITANGGSYNGTTGLTHTNYYFTIDSSKLEESLDRLAQFFIAPLFNREAVQKELEIVESEYQRLRNNEGRALYEVRKQSFNPQHPASAFHAGNRQSLLSTDPEALYQELVAFYHNTYSANRMTLVVQANKSLDMLEEIVRRLFSPVRNKNLPENTFSEKLFLDAALPMLVRAKSRSAVYSVKYTFPIKRFGDELFTKSASYVAHLLGHEETGSLLDYLRKKDWARSLSAGTYRIINQRLIDITISLTPDGYRHIDDIHAAVFQYIDTAEKNGQEKWRYDELHKMARFNFDWQEETSALDLTRSVARIMHYVPVNSVYPAMRLFSGWNKQQVSEIFDDLRVDNVIVTVTSADVATDKKTRWFDASYAIDTFDTALTKSRQARFTLPSKNRYIPDKIDNSRVIEASADMLHDVYPISWYAGKKNARASLHFGIGSAVQQHSATRRALIALYISALNQRLAEKLYTANLAGLHYRVYSHLSGITIRCHGYAQKLPLLFTEVLQEVSAWQLSKQEFINYRNEKLRSLRNRRNNSPGQRVGNRVVSYLLTQVDSIENTIRLHEQLRYSDWLKLTEDIRQEAMELKLLGYGGIDKKRVISLARLVAHLFANPATKVAKPAIRTLADSPVHISEPKTEGQVTDVLELYIQAPQANLHNRVAVKLLANVMRGAFFYDLRTQRNLGYQASVFEWSLLETPGLGMIVESDKVSSRELVTHFQRFIKEYAQRLQVLDNAGFVDIQQGVIASLSEHSKTIASESSYIWHELYRPNTHFTTREQLIETARRFTLEELRTAYRNIVEVNNRKIWAHTETGDNSAFPGSEVFSLQKETKAHVP